MKIAARSLSPPSLLFSTPDDYSIAMQRKTARKLCCKLYSFALSAVARWLG